MGPPLNRILSKKLRVFCEHGTIHGAYYLYKGPGACIAWGAIMVAGVALWGMLSHMIWHKYGIEPTVTVVESTYYQSDTIPFPAVMICDEQPVFGPKTKNVTDILCNLGYNTTQIEEFYDGFTLIQNTSYVPPKYMLDMHSHLRGLGFTFELLTDMFKKPCSVIMKKCNWRSKKYNCSEMFQEVVTVVGHCCLFNINNFKNYVPVNTTLKPGFSIAEGLEVTADGIKSFPNGTVTDGAVLLYVFDPAFSVNKMNNPIYMWHSSYYDVDIEVFAIDSSPEVKALSLKYRKCTLHSDKGIGASTYHKCIATLLMRKVINHCKCLPLMYSAEDLSVDKFPNCTWEEYLCIYRTSETTLADMQSLIDMHECYQNCDYMEYDPRVESLKRIRTAKNDTYTQVSVHYAASTCMKYRREVIYTWDQMLANLGGIFGLCLGGSIISIIEIVWFLIDLLVTTLTFKDKKPTENIFIIEKDVAKRTEKSENARHEFVHELKKGSSEYSSE